jgi:hypothetical protein
MNPNSMPTDDFEGKADRCVPGTSSGNNRLFISFFTAANSHRRTNISQAEYDFSGPISNDSMVTFSDPNQS